MKKFRKLTALFCAGIMMAAFLAGCGNRGSEVPSDSMQPGNENTVSKEENTDKSMGRYLEKEMALPEELADTGVYLIPYLKRLSGGELMLVERSMGKYISSDNGETWEAMGCPWSDVMEEIYITDIALAPDGGAAIIGLVMDREDSGETEAESEEEAESAEAVETAEAEAEPAYRDITYAYYYYDAAGNKTKMELPEDMIIRGFGFDNENRMYAFENRGKVYRIDPADGSRKELFTADGTVDFACFTDKYMVGVTTNSVVALYDIGQDMTAEADKVLEDFVGENLKNAIGNIDVGHSLVFAAGEQEDIVYFAYEGGLYRHVIGGTVIEQIIDGAISTFGDPSEILMDLTMLPDNEFVALFRSGKLYRYTYDPNVPTIPDKQLKLYSLQENSALRQAASMFQKSHQDVYIRYEIGMSGSDGVTREDAIRNLNTKIMSGEGPDILLLDGLPKDSYVEKGIMADVSSLTADMTGDAALFPNIVEASKKDGKIYALPLRIQIPMMVGKAEDVRKVKDMDSLAGTLEEIREQNPEGALLGVRTPQQLLYILRFTCSAAWTDGKGTIDEKALEEFLTAAKRIWQAEISGVPEEELGVSDSGYGSIDNEFAAYYGNVGSDASSVAMGNRQFSVGKITGIDFEYDMATTLIEEGYDLAIETWNGQVKNGYIPYGLAGIAANSTDNETAMEFYKYLFSKELQDMSVYMGLPVNMASFDELKKNPRPGLAEGMDERYAGSMSSSTPGGGRVFSIELMWPTEADFQKLKDAVSAASAVCTGDTTIENTVFEIGARALEGSITPQEAVQEIVKKSAIYLAE